MDEKALSVDSLHISPLLGVGEANFINKLLDIDCVGFYIQQCLERLATDKGFHLHASTRLFLHVCVDD